MRIEADFHVADATGHFCRRLKLLNRKIELAHPATNDSIIIKDVRSIERFLFRTRELNGAPTFAQGFLFSSQSSVDETQDTESWFAMWIYANNFLLFRARCGKSGPRYGVVRLYPCDQTFPVMSIKCRRTYPPWLKVIAVAGHQYRQHPFGRNSVAVPESKLKERI